MKMIRASWQQLGVQVLPAEFIFCMIAVRLIGTLMLTTLSDKRMV